LQAWKHLCGYLEAYVAATESMAKSSSKEYDKVLKTVQEPLKEGHHFDQSVGGAAAFFENLRANTARLSSSHIDTATALKATVLPILERLHKEIKDRSKHVKSECDKGTKTVTKARNATQNYIELLGQHSAAFESAGGASAGGHSGLHLRHTTTGGKPKPDNDPYLLHRGVLHRLHKQVLEENTQRQDLLGVQNHFQQFEMHIVQTIQQALQALNQTMVELAEISKTLYGDIAAKGQMIPPDFEWHGFTDRYTDTLINPNGPKRSVDALTFPNQEHKATKPLIEGTLSRKGKIMRSYNSAYYVLTPSKYLHEFKDNDTLNKEPAPEMSLYLPDCTVGALSKAPEGKFVVSGKDAGGLKGLSQKHEYAFKAGNHAEGGKWHELISSCAGISTMDTPVTPSSPHEKSALPSEEKAASPPAYERHDSQESGITRTPTTKSP